MSHDPLNSRSKDRRSTRLDLIGLEPDEIEAARLTEILTSIEQGIQPDLDPSEDPALAALTQTALVLRRSLEAASAQQSFERFHHRSLARVIAATPQPARVRSVEHRRDSLLQRWNGLFTSLSAAAAASIATFVVTVLAVGGSAPASGPLSVQSVAPDGTALAANVTPLEVPRVNLTALSVSQQVSLYVTLIERLNALNDDGLPADESLLRDLADTSATVKRTIERDPTVSGADAFRAMHRTFEGQQALEKATVASEADQQVLFTAQETAAGAYVTAAQFLGVPGRLPSAGEAAQALALEEPSAEVADSEVTEDPSLLPEE